MLQWRVFTLRSLMLSSQGQVKAGNAQQCSMLQHVCNVFWCFPFECRKCRKWQSTATEKCLQCFARAEVGCPPSKLVLCSYEKLRQLMAADGSCVSSDYSDCSYQMRSEFSAPFSAKQLALLPARAGLPLRSTWDMEGLVSRVSRQLYDALLIFIHLYYVPLFFLV